VGSLNPTLKLFGLTAMGDLRDNVFFNQEIKIMAGHLKYLDDSNFEAEIAKGVTLVDFYADWCGPCRMIAPIIDELAEEYNGKAKIAKLDIEKAQSVTTKFGVTSIPTLILFKDGAVVKTVVGLRGKEDLESLIKGAL
jgi:thioredoxin 1